MPYTRRDILGAGVREDAGRDACLAGFVAAPARQRRYRHG